MTTPTTGSFVMDTVLLYAIFGLLIEYAPAAVRYMKRWIRTTAQRITRAIRRDINAIKEL